MTDNVASAVESASQVGANLTASDRCDRCSAAAQTRVTLDSGFELLFCGHHFSAHRDKLVSSGATVAHQQPVAA